MDKQIKQEVEFEDDNNPSPSGSSVSPGEPEGLLDKTKEEVEDDNDPSPSGSSASGELEGLVTKRRRIAGSSEEYQRPMVQPEFAAPIGAQFEANRILMEAAMQRGNSNLIDDIMARLEPRLASIDSRLVSLETRMSSMETRMSSMETRMSSMETRMSSMETRMSSMDDKMDAANRWTIAALQEDNVTSTSDSVENALKVSAFFIDNGTSVEVFDRFPHPLGLAINKNGKKFLLVRESFGRRILLRVPGTSINKIVSKYLHEDSDVTMSGTRYVQVHPPPFASVLLEVCDSCHTHAIDVTYLDAIQPEIPLSNSE